MSIFYKMVSFIAVACVTSGAFAATGRTSVSMAARRMPVLSKNVVTASTPSTNTSSSTANLLDNIECIETYNECIKAEDACGPNFEECTNRVLFHAQMPKCISTLAQCSTAGVSSLFGTSNSSALAGGETKNEHGEITDYTYPTNDSVLGQLITAGAISNQYDTGTCVKKYTNCLKKDSVCGMDFELCTTNGEFKRQRVLCDSTLARCQSDAKKELFGDVNLSANPKADSRVGQMITEGAGLAAVNMVSTCYKVADQCIVNACTLNPIACQEGATAEAINAAYQIEGQSLVAKNTEVATTRDVNAFIKAACLNTVGANKYCYAIVEGNGVMPTSKQLLDEDVWDTVYGDIYDARMNAALKGKIGELVAKFDTRAKDKCAQTIQSCAMRSCGEGVGAVCYTAVFGNGGAKSINAGTPYEQIKTGCADVVNTDPNCVYAALNANNTGTSGYTANYMYANQSAFDTLFPAAVDGETSNDPISAVAKLNGMLSTSYNAAAIADMKKQCQNVATSCVRSLCGTDYMNCYRSRTDVQSSLTNTGDAGFDKSMNKVGGVLDYTIVLGLCLDTVKNAEVCEEHLAIEQARFKKSDGTTDSWGDATSVRGGWIDAGAATKIERDVEVVQETDANGNKMCTTKGNNGTLQGICNTVDEQGNVYDQPVMIEYITYVQSQAAQSLFKDLIYDLEKEAQAKYNAKLTREQQMCMANNNGGVMGKSDIGGAYMWAKLRNNKVPKDYTVNGLGENHFVASNELYGSFCRMRVTLQSDDKDIQDAMRDAKWTTAYFAVGDAFTCGSWIPSEELEKIGNKIGCREAGGVWDAGSNKCNVNENQERIRKWATALGAVGLGTGGFFAGDAINQKAGLGGLVLGKNKQANTDDCSDIAKRAHDATKLIADVKNPDETLNVGDVDMIVTLTAKAVSTANSNKVSGAATANAMAASLKTKADAFIKARTANRRITQQFKFDCANQQIGANNYSGDNVPCEPALVNQYADAVVSAAKALQDDLETLSTKCSKKYDDNKGTNWAAPVVMTAVGAAAGGLITNYAVRDAQEAKLTEAQKAAYDEWMSLIGEHISCYIGSEEAGTYGSVIQSSVE